jgi:predicted nucleotidyltransferase component of viral defense system
MLNDKLQREVFHFLFLEKLLKISEPKFYVLKGGVNFRFFFQSSRYSEDMDIDVVGGSVETLKKNGYKVLQDSAFIRSLKVYGITDVVINDPLKAKQTSTTQRFKIRLINDAGEAFPTKVEFSRRTTVNPQDYLLSNINPKISAQFKRLSFSCFHYSAESAARQKVQALAGRAETQARDVFDLYLLYLGGGLNRKIIIQQVSADERLKAIKSLESLSYDHFLGQVVEYLEPDAKEHYQTIQSWNLMIATIKESIHE